MESLLGRTDGALSSWNRRTERCSYIFWVKCTWSILLVAHMHSRNFETCIDQQMESKAPVALLTHP